MFAMILGFLAAIPQLISIIMSIISLINGLPKDMRKPAWNKLKASYAMAVDKKDSSQLTAFYKQVVQGSFIPGK